MCERGDIEVIKKLKYILWVIPINMQKLNQSLILRVIKKYILSLVIVTLVRKEEPTE